MPSSHMQDNGKVLLETTLNFLAILIVHHILSIFPKLGLMSLWPLAECCIWGQVWFLCRRRAWVSAALAQPYPP